MKNLLVIILAVTLFSCSDEIQFTYSDSADVAYFRSGDSGVGGSMARFTVVGDYLYSVTNSKLMVFNVSNLNDSLKFEIQIPLSWDVETIFPLGDYLYLGTLSGMYIFDISTPNQPQYVSQYEHVVSCDPVVVHGNYAYVTLHSDFSSRCWRNVNELQIIDVSDKESPKLIKRYTDGFTKPLGLGVSDDYLFVCDDGLKVFDRTDPENLFQTKHFKIKDPYDVIPLNDVLMVVGGDGLHQYAFNSDTIIHLSHIPLN